MPDWKDICSVRKNAQLASIPREWIIALPPETETNVMNIPRNCGLLTTRELQITETTDVAILLNKLRSSEWSSLEVTTAFYKRSIIAQQLARLAHPNRFSTLLTRNSDKLPYRNIRRTRSSKSARIGRDFKPDRENRWPPAWPAHLLER